MEFMPSREILISIFGLDIYWYGFFIFLGIIIASTLSIINFKKHNLTTDNFIDVALPTMIMAILGARIWYVIFKWNEVYKYDFMEIFRINNGGLAIQGGVLFGLVTAIIVLRKNKIPVLLAGDCIMPNVLLAQALGRWGNFVNQEAFGSQCSLEFLEKLHLPQFIIDGMYIDGAYWHPTFLYESLLNILGFLIIFFIVKRFSKTNGVQFGSYFIWYGFIRFFIEALRTDSLMFMGLKMAQITSFIFVFIGLVLIFIAKKQKPEKLYNILK